MPDGFNGSLGLDFTARDLSGPAFASLNQKLDQVASKTESMAGAMERASPAAETFKGVLSALTVDKLIDDFEEFNDRVVKQTAGFKDMAERLQLTTTQYQALRLASVEAGTSQEVLQTSLVKFLSTLGGAEQGLKSNVEALDQLGVKILNANGTIRPTNDLLQEAAQSLLQMQDGALKARLETELFGRSGADLNPMLDSLAKGVDALTAKFQQAGLIVDQDTVEKLHRLEVQSQASQARFEAFYATVATPIYLGVMDEISRKLIEITNRTAQAHGAWQKFVALIGANDISLKPMGMDPDQLSRLQQMAALQSQIASFDGRIANHRQGDAPTDLLQAKRDQLQAQLDSLRSAYGQAANAGAKDAEIAAERDRLMNDDLPAKDSFHTAGAKNPTVKSGAGKRDQVGDSIARLEKEKIAADQALARLMAASTSEPLDQIKQQVDLQKKIDDEVAKLGIKAKDDPRRAQLEAEVTAQVKAEDALKRYQEAMAYADQITRKYGDGSLALNDTMRKLNDAYATGRLSTEAFTMAVNDATYAQQQQELQSKSQGTGLDSLAAGFEYAANAYAHQNTMFQTGAQVFQQSTQIMSNAMTNWRKTGQFDMQAFLSSWLDMIDQMLMKWASAQLFGQMGGGQGGGLFGDLVSGIDDFFTTSAADSAAAGNIAAGAGSYAGAVPFADGGDYQAGVPRLVGERSEEVDIPGTSGTILNRDKLAKMMGADPAGGDVHVHVHVTTGVQDTVRAEIMSMMPTIQSAAISAVQRARQSGGSFAKSFR
jgi:lambda family phage tail tape measure protein